MLLKMGGNQPVPPSFGPPSLLSERGLAPWLRPQDGLAGDQRLTVGLSGKISLEMTLTTCLLFNYTPMNRVLRNKI